MCVAKAQAQPIAPPPAPPPIVSHTPISQEARTWGMLYQSESDQKKMEAFDKHSSVPLDKGVEKALDKSLSAFVGDKGITNQAKLKSLLIRTAKHESLGGKFLEQDGGRGPARGAWQVEPATARDILNTSGLIGKKAEAILGLTKKQILAMNDKALGNFLKKHDNNAVFATAKYLQAADAKGKLKDLQ